MFKPTLFLQRLCSCYPLLSTTTPWLHLWAMADLTLKPRRNVRTTLIAPNSETSEAAGTKTNVSPKQQQVLETFEKMTTVLFALILPDYGLKSRRATKQKCKTLFFHEKSSCAPMLTGNLRILSKLDSCMYVRSTGLTILYA